MTSRENLCAALDFEQPAWIPFTVNQEFVTDDPAWEQLFAAGLSPIPYVGAVREETHEVERIEAQVTWQGQPARRTTLRTPVGELRQVEVAGWVQEYFLKTPSDYRVMEFIVRHTQLTFDPTPFHTWEQRVGQHGLTLVGIGRTPMQTILVDYAGLENFSCHMADAFPELFALAEALEEQLLERCRLAATGPWRYISLLENFTAETWGAARFRRFHLPIYAKILPIFQAALMRVFPHMDGRLAGVARLLAETPFAGIESLTEPPEGDLSWAQARALLTGKVIWANINVGCYTLPPDDLRQWLRERVGAAAPDGRGLLLEISEDLPANWREAIPIVLDALQAIGRRA
ncbi:MAG: hypothetical protein HYV36_04810 [Lentisphaerae bacterium]|nr:hypothetical protein [Lentisphaerota bacterium]